MENKNNETDEAQLADTLPESQAANPALGSGPGDHRPAQSDPRLADDKLRDPMLSALHGGAIEYAPEDPREEEERKRKFFLSRNRAFGEAAFIEQKDAPPVYIGVLISQDGKPTVLLGDGCAYGPAHTEELEVFKWYKNLLTFRPLPDDLREGLFVALQEIWRAGREASR